MKKLLIEMVLGKPATGEKVTYNKGLLIKQTVVSKSFMDTFKWDSHLFDNIKVIENS
jgi:hypothetical protein